MAVYQSALARPLRATGDITMPMRPLFLLLSAVLATLPPAQGYVGGLHLVGQRALQAVPSIPSCAAPAQSCNVSTQGPSIPSITCGVDEQSKLPSFCAYDKKTQVGAYTYGLAGSCRTVTRARRTDATYGKPCNATGDATTDNLLLCSSFEPWDAAQSVAQQLYSVENGPRVSLECRASVGQCRYASQLSAYNWAAGDSPGDPCADDHDCGTGLRCDGSAGSCVTIRPPSPIGFPCSLANGSSAVVCTSGSVCMGEPAVCVAVQPLDGPCSSDETCDAGLFCYISPGSPQPHAGVCKRYNSLPDGAKFMLDGGQWGTYSRNMLRVCASGASVIVEHDTGKVGMCTRELDWSMAGKQCDTCPAPYDGANGIAGAYGPNLPVAGAGSVMCAPQPQGGCSYIPTFAWQKSAPFAYAALMTCLARSATQASDGRKCVAFAYGFPRFSSGTCGYYACYAEWTTFVLASRPNSFWTRSAMPLSGLPEAQPLPTCVRDAIDTAYEYANTGDNGCSLPPAWAASGWNCSMSPITASLKLESPSPSAAASVNVAVAAGVGSTVAVLAIALAAWLVLTRTAPAGRSWVALWPSGVREDVSDTLDAKTGPMRRPAMAAAPLATSSPA